MKRLLPTIIIVIFGCLPASAQIAVREWTPGTPPDQDSYAYFSYKYSRDVANAKKLTFSGTALAAFGTFMMIDGKNRENNASWKNERGALSVAQSPIDRAVMEHSAGLVATGVGVVLGGIGGYLWIRSADNRKKLGPSPSGLGLAITF